MKAKRKPQLTSGRVDESSMPPQEFPGRLTAYRRALKGDPDTQEKAWNILLAGSPIRVSRRGK